MPDIHNMVMKNPGEIHLITIGPLTNAALALAQEPRLAQSLQHLTVMGGVVRGPASLHLPYTEHNIRCDPEAAHIVLSSGAPLTLVPLDVTTQTRIRPADVERIRAAGTPFHQAVADQVTLYPPFQQRGYTHMHDPLAVAAIIRPDLVDLETMHVDVELGGRFTAAATLVRTPSAEAPANARVALRVDAPAFEAFLVERLGSE